MTKTIPMGALVVLIGPSGAGKSTFAKAQFGSDEIVSTDGLRAFFGGDLRRQDLNPEVLAEFKRRIATRLHNGLRAVADATHVHDGDRFHTIEIALEIGAPIVYVLINRSLVAKTNSGGWRGAAETELGEPIIKDQDTTYNANLSKYRDGDGFAQTIVELRVDDFKVAQPFPRDAKAALDFLRPYAGLSVCGDVHGNLTGLEAFLAHCRATQRFGLFLGDIVDYGVDTLRCAERVAQVVLDGEAAAIYGNHERKIEKWVRQERTRRNDPMQPGFTGELTNGNPITANQIKALEYEDRVRFENRFLALCQQMPHTVVIGDHLFVHGAGHPVMWTDNTFRFAPKSKMEALAAFGETTGKTINGKPERIYNWVDRVPARRTVVVGHDVRSPVEPLVVRGALGGTAVFLDTGSSKAHDHPGGHLSWLDLDVDAKRGTLVNPVFGRE